MSFSDENSEEFSENSEASDLEEDISEKQTKRSKQNNGKNKKIKNESKKNKSSLFKPPTVEELNNLKETENLYNNNLFRLQIEELVSEINIKSKTKKQLQIWLDSFRKCVENVPESTVNVIMNKKVFKKEQNIDNVDQIICSYVKNVNVGTEENGKLIIKIPQPQSIEYFGLYENSALAGPDITVHLNLKIPKKFFHVKDYLNGRYLIKKYYFLKNVAKHIVSSNLVDSLDFMVHCHNPILPILLIKPKDTKRILVKIHATPAEDTFKPARFLPDVNNIKIDPFKSFVNEEILKTSPTVFYNSTIGYDVTLSTNNEYTNSLLKDHVNIQEGVKLISIWLTQRQLNLGAGSFKKHLVLNFVSYLLAKKKINKFMSSYQVVRNFWSFIATVDLQNSPISLCENTNEHTQSFKKHFDLVFLDRTGCYNLLAFLNVEIYKKVKMECEMALKLLDENRSDSFNTLFLTKLPFYLQYDLILDLTNSLPLNDNFSFTDEQKTKYIGCKYLLTINYIYEILKKGLNKRALNIVPKIETNNIFGETSLKKLVFGVNLNPDEAFNFIEKGPALNELAEADEFRKFWGKLSSDRRFRDGSAHVSVYFKTHTIKNKRNIIRKILDFLVKEKLELKYELYYDNFDEVIVNKKIVASYVLGTNEEGCLKVVTTADDLGKKIRNLEMSLKITGIQGYSDVFSYTDVFPPISMGYEPDDLVKKQNNFMFPNKDIQKIPRYIQPIECVLQLEHSSKWPNNLEALRHLKTSFYLEISNQLQAHHKIVSHVSRDYLDVLYEGFVFRYRLFVPKEVGLLKQQMNEQGVVSYKSNQESFNLDLKLNILPKVNASLKGLQSQYPSFGPGTAIAKRWLRCQLIDDFHFPDVVLNVINASLYLNGTGNLQPMTPQVSFVRFLKFLSEFQWNVQPVVVNFNEELTKEDISEIESKLQENRDAFAPLYIVMPYDEGRSLLTKCGPSKHILHRVQELSKVALSYFLERIDNGMLIDTREVFSPNWSGYNVIIHLNVLMNPRKHEGFENHGSAVALKKFVQENHKILPVVDFNPVDKYLKLLRDCYGEFACFFHDTYGGNKIGVLWKPEALTAKDFKVHYVPGRRLKDDQLVLNVDAILEDFMILGDGIVKHIENMDLENKVV